MPVAALLRPHSRLDAMCPPQAITTVSVAPLVVNSISIREEADGKPGFPSLTYATLVTVPFQIVTVRSASGRELKLVVGRPSIGLPALDGGGIGNVCGPEKFPARPSSGSIVSG